MIQMIKQIVHETLTLDKIVGGGQALGTLSDGRKAFVWGGLPSEEVTIRVTKKKSKFVEGIVTEVHTKSSERLEPLDPASYLSTSPWQIMSFAAEQHYKAALIEEAFELHNIVLPEKIEVYSDEKISHYRNKVEFSWFGDKRVARGGAAPIEATALADDEDGADRATGPASSDLRANSKGIRDDGSGEYEETLDLAFFQRGGMGKIPVDSCSLLPEPMMELALALRNLLRTKDVTARNLKTLLIRCDQNGNCVWQLYVKDKLPDIISETEAKSLPAQGGEVIYSDPRSPASRITERLAAFGDVVLADEILGVPFRYATEGFFQVNVPVYEQALRDMAQFVPGVRSREYGVGKDGAKRVVRESEQQEESTAQASDDARNLSSEGLTPSPALPETSPDEGMVSSKRSVENSTVVDLYSGVGSIGLTIGGDNVTLVEINEHAVREMRENIARLGKNATAVLAPSERALEYITSDTTIIVDPPRAGLHADVVATLLETTPERIIYLSCNPATQARDVALLAAAYGIRAHKGYNFFPRTPHIEHLVVLDKKPSSF